MPQLRVVRCSNCGASLSADEAVREVKCVYCGTKTLLPPTAAERASQRRSTQNAILIFISLILGLTIFAAYGFYHDEQRDRSNADWSIEIPKPPGVRQVFIHHLDAAPNGDLWFSCDSEHLCGLDFQRKFLGTMKLPDYNSQRLNSLDIHFNPFLQGLIFDTKGTLLVSHLGVLYEYSITGRTGRALANQLPAGEYPTCLARASQGEIWTLTSKGDLLRLEDRKRLNVGLDPKNINEYYNCNSLVITPTGKFMISASDRFYIVSAEGKLEHTDSPNYQNKLAILPNGALVSGGVSRWLLLYNTTLQTRNGPKLRDSTWGGTGALTIRGDELIVASSLGFIAGWKQPEVRWP